MTGLVSPGLNPADFDRLAGFVKSKIGLHLRPEKRLLVESRINKRLKALGLDNYQQYLAVLEDDAGGRELNALSQALTTNVTSFFREEHHFRTLAELARTAFAPRLKKGEDLRLWSAGCSTGAEPYSMAMTLQDTLPKELWPRIRILATDIDAQVLDRATRGIYSPRETENLTPDIRQRHFHEVAGGLCINDPVRAMVQFKPLNLIDTWPLSRTVSAVFCRNVVIYFDAATQAALWQRFLKQLEPGGHLFIGHSERLDPEALRAMTSAGVTTYRKT